MRVFLAGATGVIGRPLLPRLVAAGHEVTAMTRSPERAQALRERGAEPVVCDVFDVPRLEEVVAGARPDVVVHELTALPQAIDPRRIETQLAPNDRIRTEGTRNLVQAARKAGAKRLVAQSIAFAYAPGGAPVKDEAAPLWLDVPWPMRRTVEAIAELERHVTTADGLAGTVLRYGYLYGPGTALATDGSIAGEVRKRRYPIAGKGTGVSSFVHVDDAAAATVAAIEPDRPGTYNVVDDEPAPLSEWLPAYAEALDAPPPRRVPVLLARLVVGKHAVAMLTRQSGASNARAKSELGWTPAFPTWRTGFRASL